MVPTDNTRFEEVYLKNHKRLLAIAKRELQSEAIGEELVQDVFLALYKKRDQLRNHENIEGWLTLALSYLIKHELNRYSTKKEVSLDDQIIHTSMEPNLPFESVLPQGLTEKERQLLIWYYKDDLSYKLISEHLGISVNTCRVRVFRAVNRCRQLLQNNLDLHVMKSDHQSVNKLEVSK